MKVFPIVGSLSCECGKPVRIWDNENTGGLEIQICDGCGKRKRITRETLKRREMYGPINPWVEFELRGLGLKNS